VGAVHSIAKFDPRLGIETMKFIDLGMSAWLTDRILMTFEGDGGRLLGALTGSDVDAFLNQLMRLQELDGHWIETFLSEMSKRHAIRLAQFFMSRVDYATDREIWHYRPCNYGPFGNVPLRFRESPDFALVLRQVSEWMTSRKGLLFAERSAQLFDAMFRPFDDALVEILQSWVDASKEEDVQTVAKILNQAPPRFVFEQRPFVVRFLERARQFGKEVLDRAIALLFGSAIGGVRSGTPGEPFPDDLQMKEEARKVLAELPPFHPAHELYRAIAAHADESIKLALRDREAFEE
jgi:hypothetical protein